VQWSSARGRSAREKEEGRGGSPAAHGLMTRCAHAHGGGGRARGKVTKSRARARGERAANRSREESKNALKHERELALGVHDVVQPHDVGVLELLE
jgi:hypothetical protein